MKKVLLAVIGSVPNPKAYRYAVQLSKQIQAELDVLQVENSRRAREMTEDGMPALQPKSGIRIRRTTSSGDPDAEIVNYLNQHRDVVFTIYDAASGRRRKQKKIPKWLKQLPVPLVVVRS